MKTQKQFTVGETVYYGMSTYTVEKIISDSCLVIRSWWHPSLVRTVNLQQISWAGKK